jgi:hypothetical protein
MSQWARGLLLFLASLVISIHPLSASDDELSTVMNAVFCPQGGADSYCLRAHLWHSKQVNLYFVTEAAAGDSIIANMVSRYERMKRESLLNVAACALGDDQNSAGLALQKCPPSDDIVLFLQSNDRTAMARVFDRAALAIDGLSQGDQPGIRDGRQRMLTNMRNASKSHHCLYQGGGDGEGNIKFIILVNLEGAATTDPKAAIACNTLLFHRSIGVTNIDFKNAMELELRPELRLDRVLYLSGIASGQTWSIAKPKIAKFLER